MSLNYRAFPFAMLLPVLGVVSPLLADTPAQALARLPWSELRVPKSDNQSQGPAIVIKYRIVDTATGYALAFKNEGPTTIHFGFWLNGWQAKDEAQTNGRIHLPPGEESAPVSVAIKSPGRPPASHCPLKLIHISQGEGGQGLAWRE